MYLLPIVLNESDEVFCLAEMSFVAEREPVYEQTHQPPFPAYWPEVCGSSEVRHLRWNDAGGFPASDGQEDIGRTHDGGQVF